MIERIDGRGQVLLACGKRAATAVVAAVCIASLQAVFAAVERAPSRLQDLGLAVDQACEDSEGSKGITAETVSGVRVAAPAPRVAALAGSLRGLLLIVKHLDGYHGLLAGLQHIDVGIGQHVRS